MTATRRWIYAERPKGRIAPHHYRLEEHPLPEPGRQDVLIEALWFSIDPYMRIQQAARDTWERPHPLGEVQGGAVVGRVMAVGAAVDGISPGDHVYAYSGWQEHAVVHQSDLQKLDPDAAPVETALGVLGMPGRTAWFGLMEAGRPRPEDTVVVSAAAGAVGSLVVQFAKRAGATVVGLAGGAEKCRWIEQELGVDRALNYRDFASWQDLSTEFARLGGVDVYFDNVGGMISDAALSQLNLRARVIVCGQVSQYDGGLDAPELGPRFLQHLLFQRATISGILARDFTHRMDEYVQRAAPWVRDGSLKFRQTVMRGFERLPEALVAQANGHNTGKLLVRV